MQPIGRRAGQRRPHAGPAATRPSRLSAAFRITNGRCRPTRVKKAAFCRAASSRIDADRDVDAVLAQVAQAAAVDERIRILDRDHGAPDA